MCQQNRGLQNIKVGVKYSYHSASRHIRHNKMVTGNILNCTWQDFHLIIVSNSHRLISHSCNIQLNCHENLKNLISKGHKMIKEKLSLYA